MNDLHKARILIVEDNPTNARMLARGLSSDYKISLAASGTEALEMARSDEAPPNLILLDINLPGLSGHRVCALLKENTKTRDIPVIFITAKNSETDEEIGLDLGAADYIAKPFSLPMVKARVRSQLELKYHRDYYEKLGQLDNVTGVPNRRHFEEISLIEWRRCCRSGEFLSLVLFELDAFAEFKKQQGQQEANRCLNKMVRTIGANAKRAADLLARYEACTFALLLPQTEQNHALEMVNKIRADIARFITLPATPYAHITVSIGLASLLVRQETSLDELIKRTEEALSKARAQGGNQVFICQRSESRPCEGINEGQLLHLQEVVASRQLSETDWHDLAKLLKQLKQ